MTFDPKGMTVKAATELLSPLSDEELDALYDTELDGKGRKSLLDAITSARDDIREAAEPAPVVAAPPAPVAAKLASNEELIYRPARPGAAAAAYIVTK